MLSKLNVMKVMAMRVARLVLDHSDGNNTIEEILFGVLAVPEVLWGKVTMCQKRRELFVQG